MRLSEKVALITGSNKGIGLSIVRKFLEEGAFVYAGIRNIDEVSDDLKLLQSRFTNNLIITNLDVTNSNDCKEVIQAIKIEKGKIDILVNNAGIVSYELLPFLDFDKFNLMVQTNLIGLVRVSQLASRIMVKQKSGSIINISSIVAVKGVSGQAAYSATKGAVNSFTLSLAKELSSSGIRVNALAPGMVSSERLIAISGKKFSEKLNQIGFGRMATTDEIANVCLFFAGDESKYITGQIVGVDGGIII
jgi:3-oxoacyl-[acyl-carrier protein] reductase